MGDSVNFEIPLLPSFFHLFGEARSDCMHFGAAADLLSQVSSLLESGCLMDGVEGRPTAS